MPRICVKSIFWTGFWLRTNQTLTWKWHFTAFVQSLICIDCMHQFTRLQNYVVYVCAFANELLPFHESLTTTTTIITLKNLQMKIEIWKTFKQCTADEKHQHQHQQQKIHNGIHSDASNAFSHPPPHTHRSRIAAFKCKPCANLEWFFSSLHPSIHWLCLFRQRLSHP